MFKWEKIGVVFNPVEIAGRTWMKEYAQAPSILVFDTYIRVFFSSRPNPDIDGLYVSRMGYIDLDRKNLFNVIDICKEPIFPLGKLGTFDEFGTYPVSVIKYLNEVRAYYAGWTRCESVPFNAAIGVAISHNNGLSFERIGEGPILSYTPDEPFVLGSPKIRRFNDIWYLWYSSGKKWVKTSGKPEPVYKIRMASSEDGIIWKKVGKDLISNVLEENECQASADVFFLGKRYHMFFSYRYNLNFRDQNRGYRIGYAWSEDLLIWTRDDSKAGIGKSSEGWDSESISYPYIFELDNKIMMFYQGNEIGRYGFGLAILNSYIP